MYICYIRWVRLRKFQNQNILTFFRCDRSVERENKSNGKGYHDVVLSFITPLCCCLLSKFINLHYFLKFSFRIIAIASIFY